MDDAARPARDEVTHGFLFADLRGYTQLVDTRGAVAASQLLERYRALTREVVAQHGGAEIKTEGDSFYVVLPSASAAVRCGLALVEACGRPPDGGEPILVGVGIHAGEAVAHEGGFVGSAVNIAARICALAGPGELLGSATVRDLTRSMGSARFVSIGRRPLKGLAEPLELVQVLPAGSSAPRASRRGRSAAIPARGWLIGGATALVIVALGLLIAVVQGNLGLTAAGPTPLPAGQASAQAPSSGGASPFASIARLPVIETALGNLSPQVAVEPGTYAPNENTDVASLGIPDKGWVLTADRVGRLTLESGEDPGREQHGGILNIVRLTVVYNGQCRDDGARVIGDRPQDLIEWIQSAPQLEASAPSSISDLGLSGIGIEATVREGLPTCVGRQPWGPDPYRVSIWQTAGQSWSLYPGTAMRVEALNYGDRTLAVIYVASDSDSLANFVNGPARRLLDSVALR